MAGPVLGIVGLVAGFALWAAMFRAGARWTDPAEPSEGRGFVAHPGTTAAAVRGGERGSVTPLVLGMVVCLLLLGAAVTAATSAFLDRQRLQNACDGAAAAAADAAEASYYGGATRGDRAGAAARDYLRVRSPDVQVSVNASGGSVLLTCTADSAITMGGLFQVATLQQSVQAVGRSVL